MDLKNVADITTQNLAPTADSGTAGSVSALRSVQNENTLSIQVSGTYTGALTVQTRVDPSAPWVTLGGSGLYNAGTGLYVSNIASGTQGIFLVNIGSYSDVRVTALAAVTGTARVSLRATSAPGPMPILTVGTLIPGTAATNLGKAEDAVAANGDTGIASFGVRVPATPAAQTSAAGDYGTHAIDAEGKIVAAQYAAAEHSWQGNPVTLTTTTSTAVKAAAAAGVRNYLTDIDIANTSATAVRVDVLDGATVIRSFQVPAGSHIERSFSMPLRGTAATALNVQLSAAVTDVRVSANGYIGV